MNFKDYERLVNMFKVGKYYLITDYNYDAITRKIDRYSHGPIEVGEIYLCRDFYGDMKVGKDKFFCRIPQTLKDLVIEEPDAEVTSFVGLSLFTTKARKLEAELQETIERYRKQAKDTGVLGKSDDQIPFAHQKLIDFAEEFSEPLFIELAAKANAIESVRQQLTFTLGAGIDCNKYTAVHEVLEDCHKRENELDDVIWLFREKQKEMKLQLLNNKADQALEEV